MAKSPAIPKALKDACKGLMFPSEADSQVEPFAWPAGPVDAAGILAASGESVKAKVEEQSLTEFFRAVPTPLRGHYFDLLLTFADHLNGVKVFKLGGGPRRTVFVVGTTADDHRVGIKIEVVET